MAQQRDAGSSFIVLTTGFATKKGGGGRGWNVPGEPCERRLTLGNRVIQRGDALLPQRGGETGDEEWKEQNLPEQQTRERSRRTIRYRNSGKRCGSFSNDEGTTEVSGARRPHPRGGRLSALQGNDRQPGLDRGSPGNKKRTQRLPTDSEVPNKSRLKTPSRDQEMDESSDFLTDLSLPVPQFLLTSPSSCLFDHE